MADRIVSGWEGTLLLGNAGQEPNVRYAFSECEVEFSSDDLNVTNSEGETANSSGVAVPGFQSTGESPGIMKARIKQPSFMVRHNHFAAPLSFAEGNYCSFRLFPAGAGNGSHFCINMKITRLKRTVETERLSPAEIELTSDGAYTIFQP